MLLLHPYASAKPTSHLWGIIQGILSQVTNKFFISEPGPVLSWGKGALWQGGFDALPEKS